MLADYYAGERFIKVIPYPADEYLKNGYMTFTDCNGTDNLEYSSLAMMSGFCFPRALIIRAKAPPALPCKT